MKKGLQAIDYAPNTGLPRSKMFANYSSEVQLHTSDTVLNTSVISGANQSSLAAGSKSRSQMRGGGRR